MYSNGYSPSSRTSNGYGMSSSSSRSRSLSRPIAPSYKSQENFTSLTTPQSQYSPVNYSPVNYISTGMSNMDLNSQYKNLTHNNFVQPSPKYSTSTISSSGGVCGLRNLGNTCYMNSVIQCLAHCKALVEYFLDCDYKKDINTSTSSMRGNLAHSFREILQQLWSGRVDVASPSDFKKYVSKYAPRFSGYQQHDSQELLRYLIQGLQEDCNLIRQRPRLPPLDEKLLSRLSISERSDKVHCRYNEIEAGAMFDLFVGQLRSTLRCETCGFESVTFDPFWDLSLPLSSKYHANLTTCLEKFTREEILDGNEKPKCEKCRAPRRCSKSFSLQRFPPVLVIHLKRFSGVFSSKINSLVEFPVSEPLDLSKFTNSDRRSAPVYQLFAVSNHIGSLSAGHYTAYAKHPYSGSWYLYDDSRVSKVNSQSVCSAQAYILFYQRMS